MPLKKGKSKRIQRILRAREPQVVEGAKLLLALRGSTSSALGVSVLRDLTALKKPDAKQLTRKNLIQPFEDPTSIEFLAEKNGCASFAFVSHSKKRPHNLVLGRTFDHHVLDMVEFGIDAYQGLQDIKGPKKAIAAQPCMIFSGEEFDRSSEHKKIKSLLLDVFGARALEKVSLKGLDHVIVVTAHGTKIFWRTYYVELKRSDSRVPRIQLVPMGPSLDLVVRRTQFASAELEKEAMREPKENKPTKIKNVSHEEFGEAVGRIHMEHQDFGSLQLRKMKALRKRRQPDHDDDDAADADGDAADDGADASDDDAVDAAAAAIVEARRGSVPASTGNARKRARRGDDRDV